MIDYIIATYLIGVVFFGGIFGIATWRLGGFQGYANLFNKFAARDRSEEISSNYVQWLIVFITLTWFVCVPLSIWVVSQAKKGIDSPK